MAELKIFMFDLATEVKSLNKRVFERIENLEKVFAKNLFENMTKMVDIKLKQEVEKVKEGYSSEIKTVHNRVDNIKNQISTVIKDVGKDVIKKLDEKSKKEIEQMKGSFDTEIQTVNKRIDGLVNKCYELKEDLRGVKNDLPSNATYAGAVSGISNETEEKIVIKMLHEKEREADDPEVTENSVEALIRDGLRLNDVQVISAERKKGNGRNPDVVIARVESREQKQKLMKNKSKLKKTRNYDKVYIEDETPKEMRMNEANLRTILREIGCSKDYVVKYGKLQRRSESDRNQGNRYGHHDEQGRDARRRDDNRSDRRRGADHRRFDGGHSR